MTLGEREQDAIRSVLAGLVVLHDLERHPLRQRAHVLEHGLRLGAGVELATSCGEDRHGGRRRSELERDPDVLLKRGEDAADGVLLLLAEDGHDLAASSFAPRYSRYGAGSISGEPVSRSIVSFGVSFRPSE